MGSPFTSSKTRKNPIHGMSMALHSTFNMSEIPPASVLREKATKLGHLKKLSGKGILTAGTWRERFCVLVKTKLYFYESEKSEGTEKSSGFVNLEYFDTCTEATTRMTRKATNVFVIGSTEKGFFESHSGRHYFAAETVTEMKEWVNAINSAMNHIRGKEKRTRDGSLTPAPQLNKKDSLKSSKQKDEDPNQTTLPRSSDRLDHVTKGRVKGPQGRRLPRKSHLSRTSGMMMMSDSRPEAVDSLAALDSDEEVRDSRGRATSLSALESSSLHHHHHHNNGKISSAKDHDTWSNASGDSDMIDSQEMDLVYKYSSDEDSDEENRAPPTISKSSTGAAGRMSNNSSFTRSPNIGSSTGTYVQNTRSGARASSSAYRGGTPLRNASVTPPCVVRKFRREQNPCIKEPEIRNSSPSPILLPEDDASKPQRCSSGSSLSTLTADTYVSNNVTLMMGPRQHSFSSLQRPGRKTNNNNSGPTNCVNNHKSPNRGGVASASASPLLGNGSRVGGGGQSLRPGQCHGGRTGSSSPYGGYSPNGTFERSNGAGGSTAKAFHLERTMQNVTKELENVSQEAKHLDEQVNGAKVDIGNVQENLAGIKGHVDKTKDKVSKLQAQVGSIEKQMASAIKEAQTMREEAKMLLEEAEHLVTFLRQSCTPPLHHHVHHSSIRPPPHHLQFTAPPSCCSSNNGSQNYYGSPVMGNGIHHHGSTGQHQQPPIVTLRRKTNKTPDRLLDSDPEMELIDETQTQMENIIAKHRKSKALLSGSSSSGSAGSNNNNNNNHHHGYNNNHHASNRNSMIEMGSAGGPGENGNGRGGGATRLKDGNRNN